MKNLLSKNQKQLTYKLCINNRFPSKMFTLTLIWDKKKFQKLENLKQSKSNSFSKATKNCSGLLQKNSDKQLQIKGFQKVKHSNQVSRLLYRSLKSQNTKRIHSSSKNLLNYSAINSHRKKISSDAISNISYFRPISPLDQYQQKSKIFNQKLLKYKYSHCGTNCCMNQTSQKQYETIPSRRQFNRTTKKQYNHIKFIKNSKKQTQQEYVTGWNYQNTEEELIFS